MRKHRELSTEKRVEQANIIKKAGLVSMATFCLCLSGCYETLDNRWVQQPDSYDHWKPMMATMPLDVHGTIPGLSLAKTLQRIPDGTDVARFEARHPDQLGLLAQPRVEMYIGVDELPTNTSYCAVAPMLKPTQVSEGRIMVAAALCDGPRLVTTVSHRVHQDHLSAARMPKTIHDVESDLLFGMAVSPVQVPINDH